MPILAIRSSTVSLQSTRKWAFRNGTDTHTIDGHCDLATELTQKTDSFKNIISNSTNNFYVECINILYATNIK